MNGWMSCWPVVFKVWFPGSPTSALPDLTAVRMHLSDLQIQQARLNNSPTSMVKSIYHSICTEAAFRTLFLTSG